MLVYQRVKHMVTQWYTIGFRPAPSIGPPAEAMDPAPQKMWSKDGAEPNPSQSDIH
jgi:hypothetical protein